MATRRLEIDDGIDFKKLEKELSAAVEADEKYTRENDAKLRAVHQRVESYDEFRDIVLASNLKPLEKGDRIGVDKKPAPWNPHTNNAPGISQNKFEQGDSEIPPLPTNSHEFVRDWKRHCQTPLDKFIFLKRLGAARLGQIFQAEISFGLLGEFLQAFEEGLRTPHQEEDYLEEGLKKKANSEEGLKNQQQDQAGFPDVPVTCGDTGGSKDSPETCEDKTRIGEILKTHGDKASLEEGLVTQQGDEAGFVYQALQGLATTQRFSLHLDFLSARERADCRVVFDHLKASPLCLEEEAHEESEHSTFSGCSLIRLAKLYKINYL